MNEMLKEENKNEQNKTVVRIVVWGFMKGPNHSCIPGLGSATETDFGGMSSRDKGAQRISKTILQRVSITNTKLLVSGCI